MSELELPASCTAIGQNEQRLIAGESGLISGFFTAASEFVYPMGSTADMSDGEFLPTFILVPELIMFDLAAQRAAKRLCGLSSFFDRLGL